MGAYKDKDVEVSGIDNTPGGTNSTFKITADGIYRNGVKVL